MSNFDDYDFDFERETHNNSQRNYNYNLDDELDMYEYDDYEPDMRRHPQGGRPQGQRPYGSRPQGSRPQGQRPGNGRPAGARPSNGRPQGQRPQGSRPQGSRPQGQRPSNGRPTGSRTSNGRPTGSRPQGQRPAPSRSANTRPAGRGKASNGTKKKKRTSIIVIEVVAVLLLCIVFFFWNKFGKVNWDNIEMENIKVNNLDEATEKVLDEYTTIALFGVDNRSNGKLDSGNSDTIMVVSIKNDTKEVKMVSVQRDTYLQVENDLYRKCNYAYNHGGVQQAMEMLNKNLDIKIDGYVSVDFYALATIVDDLGGLDLEVTQKMIDTNNPETGQNALAGYIAEVENVLNYYPDQEEGWKMSDCYFDSPGMKHLNGAQVVGFCRNRYAVNNDYGRAENQRKVIQLIVEKTKQADPLTINKIADDVLPKISTSIPKTQCISMATAAKDYSVAASSGFPFALKTTTISQKTGSVVVPCTLTSNVVQLHKFLYDQDDYDPTDDMVDVISDHIKSETGLGEGSAEITQNPDGSGN